MSAAEPGACSVALARERFDPFARLAELEAEAGEICGALASFVGRMRGEGGCTALVLDHHPGMTLASMEAIAAAAAERWSCERVAIVHRVGRVLPGEAIVLIAALSRHRADALAAVEYMIDRLKTDAMLWKKEERAEGSAWVEARDVDRARSARWADGQPG